MTSVCVVDNEEVFARSFTAMLQGLLPADLYTMLNPALRVQDVPQQADVVVCDLHLKPPHAEGDLRGHISGSEAVRYLTQELGTQVVAASGLALDETVVAALGAGARSYVSKHGGFRSRVWELAIESVAQCRYFITAQLASIIQRDAQARPLTRRELSEQDKQLLRDVIETLNDRDLLAKKWHFDDEQRVSDHIWDVCRRRDGHYRIDLPPTLLEAAPLLAKGMKQADVQRQLGLPKESTIRALRI